MLLNRIDLFVYTTQYTLYVIIWDDDVAFGAILDWIAVRSVAISACHGRSRVRRTLICESSEIFYVIDDLAILIVFKLLIFLNSLPGPVLLLHLMQDQRDDIIFLLLQLRQFPLHLALRPIYLMAQRLKGGGEEVYF